MEAIEALARVDVLCLDKTGTITTGELTVDEVIPFGVDKEMIHDIMGTLVYAFTETNATSTALQAFFKETDTYSVTDRKTNVFFLVLRIISQKMTKY